MLNFSDIAKKWQDRWEKERIGEVDIDSSKPKFFLIWAYLTVSGFHHIGHMRGFSYADAICRYKRMQGYNVLMPAGGHASGNSAVSKAQKVANKDKETIDYYKSMGLTDNDLKKISTTEGFIDFFSKKYIQDYKEYGFIGDWRRFTVTTNKDYNKFIEWQFKKLKELNLLVQKPYYATACIKCGPVAVDPSEMDLSKGGNAQKNEYVILKLEFERPEQYIVVATLRPETIFGQTNVWLDYDIEYVKIIVGNEIWIASKEFAEKLMYQKDVKIEVVGKIAGKELVGKYVTAPVINRKIIILPSKFCDPKIGTGIVTSVPSDAPADWIGLYDLQRSKQLCDQYSLNYEEIKEIKPIPIIKSKDYGELPAIEICKELDISSQNDIDKLEKAKKEIYSKGFHTGIMLENSGKYSGMKVEQAKELIKKNMLEDGVADIFYDLSEEVVCRCGNPVIVKKIDNQWFIKYSDKALTENTIKHAKEMLLLPELYKKNLPTILEWFDDRACARQGRWVGTKLPFDDSYTIEPIADSTLYPIFYLISLYTNLEKIKEEQLIEEFFDYVFLDKGNLKEVSSKTKIEEKLLEKIRADVEYWYPLDINLGGQEHQTVHFPVFLMNHVGILSKKYWPKGIIVNWWVVNKSGKISKSKGGVRSIGEEASKYSVDAIRLFYANVASPFVNIDFPPEDLEKYKQRLDRIYSFVNSLIEDKNLCARNANDLDKWLESTWNFRLKNIIEAMNKIELKEATDDIYFNSYNDLHWYLRRGGCNKSIIMPIIKEWVKTLGIFTPHLAEELNEILGSKELVAISRFPSADESKINLSLDLNEKKIEDILSDIRNVVKLSGKDKPNKITLFISKKNIYEIINFVLNELRENNNFSEAMKFIGSNHNLNNKQKAFIVNVLKKKISDLLISQEDELGFYNNIREFLCKELETEITIVKAEGSNNSKAEQSLPGKPGIFVE